MKSLGTPIANDMVYGGAIVNDGRGREDEWSDEFEGCYDEQEGIGGTRMFLMLWLHA